MEKLLSQNQAVIRSSLVHAADEYDRVVNENIALFHELLELKSLMQSSPLNAINGVGQSVSPPTTQVTCQHELVSQPVEDTSALDIMDERSNLVRPTRKMLMPDLSPTLHMSTKKPQVNEGALDLSVLFVEVSDEVSSPGSTDSQVASGHDAHRRVSIRSSAADYKLTRMDHEASLESKGFQVVELSDRFLPSGHALSLSSQEMLSARPGEMYSLSSMEPETGVGSLTSSEFYVSNHEDEQSQEGLFPRWFDPGKDDFEFEIGFGHDKQASVGSKGSHKMAKSTSKTDGKSDRCVLNPVGKFRITWDGFALLCLLYELWITPFDLVFLDSVGLPSSLTYIGFATLSFFAVDILLNFSTGYVIGDKTVMERSRIVKNYLRVWFWVDFVSTLPWDIILSALGGGMFSMAKVGKGARILKSLRYLKLIRVARLMKALRQAGLLTAHFQILEPLRIIFVPLQVSMFLFVFSHIHGCIWASLQPEWVDVDTMSWALRNYYESFWWAFTMVTLGVQYRTVDSPGAWTFEMVLSGERLLLLVLLAHRVFLNGLRYLEDVQAKHAKEDVLAYLREHRVPFPTQIQVMFSLNDTGAAEKRQRKVNELLSKDLPMDLVKTINEDLWTKRLMSLGIIARVADWMPGFVEDVAQTVKEEVYASRTMILRLGDASVVAYCIISGKLTALKNPILAEIPPFTERMWVGESALVSTVLRCSATIVSEVITSLMAISGEIFQQIISKFGMMQDFQAWCAQNLWKGLCGRCGQLGSHFSDNCPYTGYHVYGKSSAILSVAQLGRGLSTIPGRPSDNLRGPLSTERLRKPGAHNDPSTPDSTQIGRDLIRFLQDNSLQWLRLVLRDIGILTLDDLERIDFDELKRRLPDEHALSDDDWKAVAPESIKAYRQINTMKTQKTLFCEVSRLHHLMFLSHYKLEAGTEAALMRTELENAIGEDPGSLGHSFDEPVFLDSENLQSLEDLQQRVINSHNLVLLLTENVLTRPWVLIEIVTAKREGVRILLVNVSKPGGSFEFPDDVFYEKLRNGNFLDPEAIDVMARCGCEMVELEEALRAVFQQIAVPYSPHKAKSIRRAEIGAVLRQCKLKNEGMTRTSTSKEPRDNPLRNNFQKGMGLSSSSMSNEEAASMQRMKSFKSSSTGKKSQWRKGVHANASM